MIKEIYDQIEPFKDRRAGKLSGGMKQKLALCCALIHKPEVLLLDEPTTGVDAVSRKEFWSMLKKLKCQGITILVSTPYMDEATLCERIALIQNGIILSVEVPDNIIKAFPVILYAAKSNNIYKLLNDFRDFEEVDTAYLSGEYLHLTMRKDASDTINILKDYAEKKGHTLIDVKRIEPTIEDSFIRLTQDKSDPALI